MDREKKIEELEKLKADCLKQLNIKTESLSLPGKTINQMVKSSIGKFFKRDDSDAKLAEDIARDYLTKLYKKDARVACFTVQKVELDSDSGNYNVLCSLYKGEDLDKLPHLIVVNVQEKKVMDVKVLKEESDN